MAENASKLARVWRWAYPGGGHSDVFEGLGPEEDMAARALKHGVRVQHFIEYIPGPEGLDRRLMPEEAVITRESWMDGPFEDGLHRTMAEDTIVGRWKDQEKT